MRKFLLGVHSLWYKVGHMCSFWSTLDKTDYFAVLSIRKETCFEHARLYHVVCVHGFSETIVWPSTSLAPRSNNAMNISPPPF